MSCRSYVKGVESIFIISSCTSTQNVRGLFWTCAHLQLKVTGPANEKTTHSDES